MPEYSVSKVVDAPKDAVWEVLADFPTISQWADGVTNSYALDDTSLTRGVGARRHCDLKPMGTLQETVTGFEEGEHMVVRIDSATKLPIRQAQATFSVAEVDGGTQVSVDGSFDTKWGPIGKLMAPMVNKRTAAGFESLIDELGAAANARA